MNLKNFMLVLFLLLFTALNVNADIYTQTLTIGENDKELTQYKENKDNSFYTKEETNQVQPANTIVIPTVQYVPVTTYQYKYPYTFSTYSYYPSTNLIHYNRPYYCVKEPCSISIPPSNRPGINYPQTNTQGGVQVHTNFAGGYSFGGDTRNWTTTRPGGIYRQYGTTNSGINVQIK